MYLKKKSFMDAIISIVPVEVRKRNLLAAIIFAILLVISFHLVTIDVSKDDNQNGEITLLETEFKLKSLKGDNLFQYGLAAALVGYAICIPVTIANDDI